MTLNLIELTGATKATLEWMAKDFEDFTKGGTLAPLYFEKHLTEWIKQLERLEDLNDEVVKSIKKKS